MYNKLAKKDFQIHNSNFEYSLKVLIATKNAVVSMEKLLGKEL